ncbi:hypothetical protein [Yoonia sp. 208BN28-4]|uniref:hypothetical protein n=1 Tax=Yoonia sp. 208BN28-4 TaxID=3126505 RepID=UPI0030A5AA49
MPYQDKNLQRALAILATHPDERDIAFQAGCVLVAKQKLSLQDEDDLEVLSILMTDKEHGFAVTRVEETARELREMQVIWMDAANVLKLDAAA